MLKKQFLKQVLVIWSQLGMISIDMIMVMVTIDNRDDTYCNE